MLPLISLSKKHALITSVL